MPYPFFEWYKQMMGGEHPTIVCHPSMEQAAHVIAKEFEDSGCKVHVTSLVPPGESKVMLVDPFGKIDKALFAYVLNRYSPGVTWNPEDAF
jgi:hypothetical protein